MRFPCLFVCLVESLNAIDLPVELRWSDRLRYPSHMPKIRPNQNAILPKGSPE
jgi:hypothetical protein